MGPKATPVTLSPPPEKQLVSVQCSTKTGLTPIIFFLMKRLSEAFPQASVVVVGEEPHISRHREPWFMDWVAEFSVKPNVHTIGWRPQAELPRYYQAFDVILIPYAQDNRFNLLILGLGPFLGNFLWGWLGDVFSSTTMVDGQPVTTIDYHQLFLVPIAIGLLATIILAVFFHPKAKPPVTEEVPMMEV